MPSDVLANAVTCGSWVTSGLTKTVADSRSHKAFRAPRMVLANQSRMPSMSLSTSQPPMSAPDPTLDDGEQDRCEDGEGVSDQGRLECGLGLLDLGRVAAGGQVSEAADGEEEGRDADEQADDPGRDVGDDGGQVVGGQDLRLCRVRWARPGQDRQRGRGDGGDPVDDAAVHGEHLPPGCGATCGMWGAPPGDRGGPWEQRSYLAVGDRVRTRPLRPAAPRSRGRRHRSFLGPMSCPRMPAVGCPTTRLHRCWRPTAAQQLRRWRCWWRCWPGGGVAAAG